MGQEFGVMSTIAMPFACICIVVTAGAALAMWWKRRPADGFGAPSTPTDFRISKTIAAIALGAAVFFPRVGLNLLAMLALDLTLPKALRARLA